MKILPHSLYSFLFLGSQLVHLRTASIINSFSNCDFVFVRVYMCAWACVYVCVQRSISHLSEFIPLLEALPTAWILGIIR